MEHQAQAAPPCGKESGYSVLNHLEMVHVDVNLLAPSICGILKDKAGLIFLFCPSLLPKDFFVLQGDWGERKRKRASPASLLIFFLSFIYLYFIVILSGSLRGGERLPSPLKIQKPKTRRILHVHLQVDVF